MTVRSDQFVSVGVTAGAGTVTLAVVPAGEKWLVRELTIHNSAGLAGSLQLTLTTPSGLPRPFHESVPSQTTINRLVYQVWEPGDVLSAVRITGITWEVMASGSRLVI